jgi:hypothetical protein
MMTVYRKSRRDDTFERKSVASARLQEGGILPFRRLKSTVNKVLSLRDTTTELNSPAPLGGWGIKVNIKITT